MQAHFVQGAVMRLLPPQRMSRAGTGILSNTFHEYFREPEIANWLHEISQVAHKFWLTTAEVVDVQLAQGVDFIYPWRTRKLHASFFADQIG